MRTTGLALMVLTGCTAKDNLSPVADAGPDQAVLAGTTALLDGSASEDAGGNIETFDWQLVSAPSGTLGGLVADVGATPSLVTDLPGNYVVSLIVTDGDGNSSAPDVVEILATEPSTARPEAVLLTSGDLGLGLPLALDGAQSTAPAGRTIERWKFTVVHGPSDGTAKPKAGDNPWEATFTPDAIGTWVLGLTVFDESTSSRTDTAALSVDVLPDLAPIARCGPDQAIATGNLVTLDGSASFDPEGAGLTFSWQLSAPGASETSLADSETASPRFMADVKGDYTATLTVSDGGLNSEPCTVLVQASKNPSNQAPVAFAGGAQSVSLSGSPVILDGSDSFDPDGDEITHTWEILTAPAGSSISTETLSDPDQAVASFTPDAGGTYYVSLQVCDGAPLCASDTATITVGGTGGNEPPIADAGDDTVTEVGRPASLDGSNSSDPNGDTLTFAWTIETQPSGSAAIVEDADLEIASLQPDVAGLYVVRLTVDDGATSDSDLMQVEAVPEGTNLPPECEETEDQEIELGEVVLLDGSGTTDPNGDTLSYLWTLISAPDGSTIGIDDPTAEITALRPDVGGEYVVQFQAMDGTENCFFQFTVTVEDTTPNTPPVCDAGDDLTVDVGATAVLDGTASTDVDGDTLSYLWRIIDAPGGSSSSIDASSEALASFTPDVAGLYTIELTVSDGTDTCATGIVISAEAPVVNDPPLCRIATDSTVEVGQAASLDASGTSDPDGDTLSFTWSVTESPLGATSAFGDATAVSTTWSADTAGAYQFELVVSDGIDSCSETFEINVTESENNPPECDAGPDLTAEIDEEVTLDARGTTDPDGDPMTYQWRVIERPDGSAATISDLTLRLASFTPDVAGTYTIRFAADDGTDRCTDDMTLTVTGEPNNPPECDAGPDLAAEIDEEVTLDARATTDPDGDPMTYQWRVIERPTGSTAIISDLTLRLASFTPDVAGTYTIRFYADDGTDSCQDDMVLTVSDSPGSPPLADAGRPQSICAIGSVDLDGSGSSDPDGDSLTFSWAFESLPSGSSLSDADLSGSGSSAPSFTPDVAGTYVLTLTVDDGSASDSDSVSINVDSDGAVLLLHLDETSGTTTTDASPSALDGAVTGGTWSGGRFFGALGFDGSTWVSVPDDDALDISDDLTIDFWMRTDDVDTTWQAVLTLHLRDPDSLPGCHCPAPRTGRCLPQ